MTEAGVVCLPTYARRYDNSTGRTVAAARASLSASLVGQDEYGREVRYGIDAPLAEGQALARTIPDLDVGSYGWVESVVVERVLGEADMLVSEVRLIDDEALRAEKQRERDAASGRTEREVVDFRFERREELIRRQRDRGYRRTMRVVGVSTLGLVPDQRYAGPDGRGLQLAIARLELPGEDARASDRRRVLLAVDRFAAAPRLDEAQFAGWLIEVGLSPSELSPQYRAARQLDRDQAEARIFRLLLPPEPARPEED